VPGAGFSIHFAAFREENGRPNYLYRMKYQKMNVLFLIVFDGDKIAFAKGYPEPK